MPASKAMEYVHHEVYGDAKDRSLQLLLRTLDEQPVVTSYWFRSGHPPIIAVTSQLGCDAQCAFCRIPGAQRDLTAEEVRSQIDCMREVVGREGLPLGDRYKISFVKEGDILLHSNPLEVLEAVVGGAKPIIKVSSVFPVRSGTFYEELCAFGGPSDREVQIQVSLASTSDRVRQRQVEIPLLPLRAIQEFSARWTEKVGRRQPEYKKVLLSFTLHEKSVFSPRDVAAAFSPGSVAVRIRDASLGTFAKAHRNELRTETFERICQELADLGFLVIDGRTTDLAKRHDLTMGLFEIKNLLGRGAGSGLVSLRASS